MSKNLSADFEGFGTREMLIASKLLFTLCTNKPDWFRNESVRVIRDSSGNVFLKNSEEDVCVLDSSGHKLELWLSTPYHGKVGRFSDILNETRVSDMNISDTKYLNSWAKIIHREEEFYKWAVKVTNRVNPDTGWTEGWRVETPNMIQDFGDELAAHEWARLTREEMKGVFDV